jgi:hypothetical protein
MVKPFSELGKHKKSETAVLLGSGSSINDITKKEWRRILVNDVWAINNWVYHPFIVPHFNPLELKSYDFDIVKDRLNEKWEKGYNKVVYIITRDNVANAIGHKHELIYKIDPISRRGPRGGRVIDADYNPNEKVPVKSYNTSFSLIIDVLYKLGYKKIFLFGFDMTNSKYFWTDGDPKVYGKVHHQWNKQHEGKSPDAPHNTFHIKDFIVDFNRRHMIPNKREIVVGNTKTALYPELRFEAI